MTDIIDFKGNRGDKSRREAVLDRMDELDDLAGDWRGHLPFEAAAGWFGDNSESIQAMFSEHYDQCEYCRMLVESIHPTPTVLEDVASRGAASGVNPITLPDVEPDIGTPAFDRGATTYGRTKRLVGMATIAVAIGLVTWSLREQTDEYWLLAEFDEALASEELRGQFSFPVEHGQVVAAADELKEPQGNEIASNAILRTWVAKTALENPGTPVRTRFVNGSGLSLFTASNSPHDRFNAAAFYAGNHSEIAAVKQIEEGLELAGVNEDVHQALAGLYLRYAAARDRLERLDAKDGLTAEEMAESKRLKSIVGDEMGVFGAIDNYLVVSRVDDQVLRQYRDSVLADTPFVFIGERIKEPVAGVGTVIASREEEFENMNIHVIDKVILPKD